MQGLQEANFHKDTAPERKGMGILVIRGFHSKKEEQRSEYFRRKIEYFKRKYFWREVKMKQGPEDISEICIS